METLVLLPLFTGFVNEADGLPSEIEELMLLIDTPEDQITIEVIVGIPDPESTPFSVRALVTLTFSL